MIQLIYASGTKSIPLTVSTCAGGPNQIIPLSSLTTSDSSQTDRLGRDGVPSTCAGKASPGGIGGTPALRYYKTFTFTNTSAAARCYTVTINAALGGAGDIESAAYDQTYIPASLDTNYLGDTGIVGLGTTVGNASYSFTVPAMHNFVVVVNTTGTTTSSQWSGVVSGFVDQTPGPGACPATPNPVQLNTVVSRLTQGGAGTYDIDLSGGNGVECRSGGASGDYSVVMTFSNNLTSVASASVGCGTVSSSALGPNANQYTVNLTGQNSCNAQYNTVTLTNVNDSASNHSDTVASPQWGLLMGDTNGDGAVNSADISQTKSQSGTAVSGSNFRTDVTVDGTVNSADIGFVKSKSGSGFP